MVYVNVAQVPGTTQDHLQVFNIETKTKMKSYQMTQQVRICKLIGFGCLCYAIDGLDYIRDYY